MEDRSPFRILQPLLHHPDPVLRWRAIEAMGIVAACKAETDIEAVRDLIRRLFWTMNDESGNLIRTAPEAIGEILFRIPGLIPEYVPNLTGFLREEPFERGVHFALARLAAKNPGAVEPFAGEFIPSLSDPDPYIRAYASFILKKLSKSEMIPEKLGLEGKKLEIYDFDSGQIVEIGAEEVLIPATCD